MVLQFNKVLYERSFWIDEMHYFTLKRTGHGHWRRTKLILSSW